MEGCQTTPVCHCPEPCACYAEGYARGKDKAYFEMANWLPEGHGAGCSCEPCLTASVVARRLAEVWVSEAVTLAIGGRLSYERAKQLQERIAGSEEVVKLFKGVAWARAITEAFNTARVATLTNID